MGQAERRSTALLNIFLELLDVPESPKKQEPPLYKITIPLEPDCLQT